MKTSNDAVYYLVILFLMLLFFYIPLAYVGGWPFPIDRGDSVIDGLVFFADFVVLVILVQWALQDERGNE